MKIRLFAILSTYALAVIALALASCAATLPSAKGSEKASPEKAVTRDSTPTEKPERPSLTGLEAKAFAGLPDGVVTYLERLAEAVRKHDSVFLLAQGERDYEARLRTRVDEEAYLALLYRVGPYAAERPTGEERPPRLNPGRLRSIRYTGWDERGPVAEIRGMITLTDGTLLPCRISVLWKLKEPRVIGQEL